MSNFEDDDYAKVMAMMRTRSAHVERYADEQYVMPRYKTIQRYEVEFRHESADVLRRFYQELTPIMDRFGVYGLITDENEIDVLADDVDGDMEVQS